MWTGWLDFGTRSRQDPSPCEPRENPITARRPKILQVGPLPPRSRGGISSYLEGLLASPLGDEFELRALDVSVPDWLRRKRKLRPLLTLRFVAMLSSRLVAWQPQLVHVHASDYGSFWEKAVLAELVRIGRVPLVLHLHGGSFERFLKGLGRFQARLAARSLRRATSVVVPSRSAQTFLAAHLDLVTPVALPNAIRVQDFDALARDRDTTRLPPDSKIDILFLGNMAKDKGLEDLLRATQELERSQAEPFEIHLVGGEVEPGHFEYYKNLFAQAGLAKRVHFHGPADGMEKLRHLRAAQIFCLPSRRESFGIANLEAMASGLPVVSTRTGAIPEYLTDGVEGLLVEPGDVGGLARALGRLVADPALRRRLGQAGRRRVREYDWEGAARRLAALYDGLLRGGLDPRAVT